jgi:hypothetical protein
MSTDLIKFARSFEHLKFRLEAQPAGDERLMQLVRYWPNLHLHLGKSGYGSYFEEFIPLLLDHIKTRFLLDLFPAELQQLIDVMDSLDQAGSLPHSADTGQAVFELIEVETARKLFYAGSVNEGLNRLARAYGMEFKSLKIPDYNSQLTELDLLKKAQMELPASYSRMGDTIRGIIREWEITREALSFEEANCLFIEKNDHDNSVRGRLRCLHGSAEYRRKFARTDEVTFENQIKAPDDPFVGAVYGALEAVSRILGRSGIGTRTENRIRARFGIAESDHTFTGDSVGLSAALVTYTQLLQPEVLKHERFIACEAAFTGGVDAAGYLQPVNNDTLREKIKRAFFSPLRYLVLPEANMEIARPAIAELESEYPYRRLLLVGEETLSHIIENRNIIRAEKVCTGRYVMRKAHTYGRLVKVQVPLLLILLYVLICIVYPMAWFGFDRNPDQVHMSDTHDKMLVLNRNSDLLWSIDFDCYPVRNLHAEAYDLDADGSNEVLYIKRLTDDFPCSTSAQLAVHDDNGRLLFNRRCNILGEYPGDTSSTQYYEARNIFIFPSKEGPLLVTNFAEDNPARSHLKVWSSEGELLGWYVHSGHVYNIMAEDINGDDKLEILGIGINNRAGGSGLFILPVKGSFGVSPPYEDISVDLSNVKRGNQLNYILFPTSDLALADSLPYGGAAHMAVLPGGRLRVDILVQSNSAVWRSYYLGSKLQVYKVSPSDIFWTRRQKFVEGGHLPPMELENFCRWELERVRYWSENGWISRSLSNNTP